MSRGTSAWKWCLACVVLVLAAGLYVWQRAGNREEPLGLTSSEMRSAVACAQALVDAANSGNLRAVRDLLWADSAEAKLFEALIRSGPSKGREAILASQKGCSLARRPSAKGDIVSVRVADPDSEATGIVMSACGRYGARPMRLGEGPVGPIVFVPVVRGSDLTYLPVVRERAHVWRAMTVFPGMSRDGPAEFPGTHAMPVLIPKEDVQ